MHLSCGIKEITKSVKFKQLELINYVWKLKKSLGAHNLGYELLKYKLKRMQINILRMGG